MSLIKCKECSAEISDQAQTCPKCGYKRDWIEVQDEHLPPEVKKRNQYWRQKGLTGFIICLLGALGSCYMKGSSAYDYDNSPSYLAAGNLDAIDAVANMYASRYELFRWLTILFGIGMFAWPIWCGSKVTLKLQPQKDSLARNSVKSLKVDKLVKKETLRCVNCGTQQTIDGDCRYCDQCGKDLSEVG